MKYKENRLLNLNMLIDSIKESLVMLQPQIQFKNPVMFVTYLGAITTTLYVIFALLQNKTSWFDIQIMLWLWFTVIFANFAQAIAESRGKAQADSLRKTKIEAYARQEVNGVEVKTASDKLKKNDIIICEAGDIIPSTLR